MLSELELKAYSLEWGNPSFATDTTGTCQWGFHCGFEPQPGIPGAPEMPCRLLPVNQ